MCVCMHAHVCVSVCTCMHNYVCVCVCVFACAHMCMCVHLHLFVLLHNKNYSLLFSPSRFDAIQLHLCTNWCDVVRDPLP